VARIQLINGKRIRGGAAHEVFADCVDDIEGAIKFAKRYGKDIFLAGHSTGCQKSIYWAFKKKKGVRGIILLAPVSDYAATVMLDGPQKMRTALSHARSSIRNGKKHELLPESVWEWGLLADAQRYVSLYSGKSAEEVFPYWDKKRVPRALRSVKRPILVLLAEDDEYADRPATELYEWFLGNIYEGEVSIVPGVRHSFKGGERKTARLIKDFMKEYRQ
jgi:pimeloyl-ACP methyl ester carboxylesterase